MKKVKIYTDGACSGNPGDGGWCAILIYKNIEKVLSGFEAETTNNRMEMRSVIEGLSALKEKCEVEVFSDSEYVVDSINLNRVNSWKENGWKTSSKSPVKNVDLWERLLSILEVQSVKFIKVKGHSDNEYNNRCDKIAVEEYKKHKEKV
ncbi:MAG: ribonuclease HI [Clostridia bacterium]|nr:ribonuclease HI [Clostridia bacterium]